MNKIKFVLVLSVLFVTSGLLAQNQSDMRLNEALVTNTNDFQDDFGQHNPWIELFNTSYGTVNIGGCFLSNDRNNLTLYPIPKGDVLTKIKPRQHILFWSDNCPKRGTFHTNFTIKGGDTVYYVASDGRTIIDSLIIPVDLKANMSFGRVKDGDGEFIYLPHTSPSTNNETMDKKTKSSIMAETDPSGAIMALTAMSVVFLALIILYVLFKIIGNVSIRNQQRKAEKAAPCPNNVVSVKDTTTEEFAAIAMALHLYEEENNSHDDESLTITMVHTDRQYSPWSSKIYGLRQIPKIEKVK